MGPVFSIALLALAGLAALCLIYCVARFFYSPFRSLVLGALVILACSGGAMLFVVLAWLVMGSATLTSQGQVLGYLAALGASAMMSGGVVAWLYVRSLGRSNKSFKPNPLRGSA